jgi:hypothetical protein
MFHILSHDTFFRFHACGMIFSVVPANLSRFIELCTNVNDIYLAQPVDAIARYCPQFRGEGRRRRDVKRESRDRDRGVENGA